MPTALLMLFLLSASDFEYVSGVVRVSAGPDPGSSVVEGPAGTTAGGNRVPTGQDTCCYEYLDYFYIYTTIES